MQEIREKLVCVLQKNIPLSLKPLEITDKHNLREDLMIDSIAFLAILVELEHIFNISFNVAVITAAPFETVGTLIGYISEMIDNNVEGET
ncbi:MAG TPA: phosphopantetheine-binding protein [Ruminiclostridium sp.]|nr:phosphopantetheine-binding protein [Ruminiclostridium sp.]